MSAITRQRRADANGDAVIVYYRDATVELVYRYADDVAPYTLISGSDDRVLQRFDTVSELEAHVVRLLSPLSH